MKMTINQEQFMDMVMSSTRFKSFGYDGWKALFNYLEERDQENATDTEFEPVAFDGEFTRYETVGAFNGDHGTECKTLTDIRELTTVIDIDASAAFIIENC